MKRRYTWTIFQNIEYSAEQDQVRLYNFFNDLLMHMPAAAKQIKDHDELSTSSADSLDDDFLDESDDSLDEGIDEPKTYKGPHLNLPLEKQDLDMLINLFRKRKYKLHAKYVAMILREGAKKLRRLDNINKASTEVKGSKTVTVVGDLHGKLDDLLVILYKVSFHTTLRLPTDCTISHDYRTAYHRTPIATCSTATLWIVARRALRCSSSYSPASSSFLAV